MFPSLGVFLVCTSVALAARQSLELETLTPAVRFPADLVTCKAGTAANRTSCAVGTEGMYQKIGLRVVEEYEKLAATCTGNVCPRGDFAGCLVRLAGHDFMDFKDGTGGSDACIDFHDPDNAGLEPCLADGGAAHVSLEAAWNDFCTDVSLADFIVLAAEVIMVRSRPDWDSGLSLSPTLNLKTGFRFGRKTSLTCPNNPPLPNPVDSCDAVDTTFRQQMGLSWQLSTALMGVHTLGRAMYNFSGYRGWWTSEHHAKAFDHYYYKVLYGAGWGANVTSTGPRGKWQWERSDGGPTNEMMLNTDMCLAFSTDAGTKAEVDKNCCLFAEGTNRTESEFCRSPWDSPCAGHDHKAPVGAKGNESSDAVKLYAKNETAWLADFVQAWSQATQNGASQLCGGDKGDKGDKGDTGDKDD